jgi:UDP-GlcNAc3NAcA epimerase
MPMGLKVVTVLGARPQFIKAAPVSRALRAADIAERIVHTGQHFDAKMSAVFFDELGIPEPAFNLGVNSLGHGAMTGRMLEQIEPILQAEQPDWVLVYGDTNSTIAGGLAAAKLHIPVAHVEAGLRSFNRRMPEEINRVVTDHLSDLLLCPTQTAVDNLAAEGIVRGVHHVGDVMYDATLAALASARSRSRILEELGRQAGTYAVATIHRAENTSDPIQFKKVVDWLREKAKSTPIVMPVHPRTRSLIDSAEPPVEGLQLVDPIGYFDMALLLSGAVSVYTDSGGLQKEAYFHRVPCVTLRDETEWVETVEAGWNRLWNGPDYQARSDIADYGTGDSSAKIASLLAGRT